MATQRVNITDRGERYRAQRNVTGPRKCVICGSRSDIQVMHLDGNESHGEAANLAYGCRSCNGKLSAAFKRAGIGRPTNQYNPGTIPTFEQYAFAVSSGERDYYPGSTRHKAGAHDEAGAVIHATPKKKRIEYAQRMADAKRGHAFDRWNPSSDESVQDKSWREWAENYERVQRDPEKASAKDLRRALGYLDKARSSMIRRAHEKGATVDGNVLAGYDNDYEYFKSLMLKRERGNPWPFASRDARQTTPARGGIAAHMKRSRKAADDQNAEFLKSKTTGTYKGYSISKTADGEYFSSLDRDSFYSTKAQVQRSIDGYLKGRSNPMNPPSWWRRDRRGQAYRMSKQFQAGRKIGMQDRRAGREHRGDRWLIDEQDSRFQNLAPYLREGFRDGYNFGWYGPKANPAAASAEVFEEFHGYKPSETITVTKKLHYHSHLAAAGKLTHLDVWGIDGKGHKITGFKGAFLAFNEEKNQLFVEGGDQSVNLADFGIRSPHELETLGRLTDIGYQTNKTHLGDEGGEAVYVHKFRTTNDNGKHVVVKIARYPDLIYDVRNEQLLMSGGSYEILREGINK